MPKHTRQTVDNRVSPAADRTIRNIETDRGPPNDNGRFVTRMKIGPRCFRRCSFAASLALHSEDQVSPLVYIIIEGGSQTWSSSLGTKDSMLACQCGLQEIENTSGSTRAVIVCLRVEDPENSRQVTLSLSHGAHTRDITVTATPQARHVLARSCLLPHLCQTLLCRVRLSSSRTSYCR